MPPKAKSKQGARLVKRSRAKRSGTPRRTPQAVLVVNMIPRSLSGEANNDSEPNLSVNPANTLQMAASAFTPNPMGSGDAPIFVSSDGGNTWALNAIVPSDRMTADITLRFGPSGNLYAGIIRTPIVDNTPRLNVLRSRNFLAPTKMTVLVDRTGNGVDQPYIQAGNGSGGPGSARDVVFCGDNDFNQPNGRTATIDLSRNAGVAAPAFNVVAIDGRNPPAGGGDAPSIRPAMHSDGTVYGAFLHQVGGGSFATLRYDVVVVRDDNLGAGTAPFTALIDPGDGLAGRRVVQNRLIPFQPDPNSGDPGPLGQERIGSHLTIAVDPRAGQSRSAYLAWADRVASEDYTLHLRRTTDGGVTWSPDDLLTVTNALNPALAVNDGGTIGFLYQQLTGPMTPGVVTPANRWETHLRRSADGVNWDDLILSATPADQPAATGLPYLGDYIHLLAIGPAFHGVFCANNTPDRANFPNGARFQRNANFDMRTLFDVDNTTPVPVSIDPFYFRVSS